MGIEPRKTTLAVPAVLGIGGIAALAWLARGGEREVAFAYLTAFAFWTNLVVGVLALVILGHATRARWFVALRRPLEGIAATLPALAVLFIPIALGLAAIYPWARPGWLATHGAELSGPKRLWLSPGPFLARSAGYLVLWSVLGIALWRWSRDDDAQRDATFLQRARVASNAVLPVFALSLVFAANDWLMSLEPLWSSSVYGVDVLAHAFRSGVALAIVASWALRRRGILPWRVGSEHFSALGRLLLTGVILAAYTELSQGLLVWIADIPRENVYYIVRASGSWGAVLVALIVGELALPLLALLPREVKRRPGALAGVAAWLLVAELVRCDWLVEPALHPEAPAPGLALAAAVAGIGGVLALVWGLVLRGVPVIPVADPELARSLRYASP